MFAQVEDLTGTVEVTVFPRTYEATAPLWSTDEILLILARVEQRDEAPKLLCEHAVRFDDAGIAEIRRVADERRQSLAKRARFVRPTNGNGGNGGGSGVLPAVGGSPRPAYSPATTSKGTSSAVPPAQRPSSESPPPLSPSSPPSLRPSSPSSSLSAAQPELVIRFREALDYERSIAIFQRIQQVLKSHGGPSVVILELPRAAGGVRRVPTSFRALPSRELAEAVANEVGGDVVEVVLPR
jgi:DNA polymerase-3 subunit alpha